VNVSQLSLRSEKFKDDDDDDDDNNNNNNNNNNNHLEKFCRAGQAIDGNMAHAECMQGD
jgi:serine phosphatase RsbU (regulator of sigma subunit)